MRALKLTYVGVVLVLLSVGTLDMLFKLLPDVPLYGVEFAAAVPSLSLGSVRTESFQRDVTTLFERRWGLRGYAVRSDNTLIVRVFGEMRTHDPAILEDEVLINWEDIGHANKTANVEAIASQAKLVARVQRKLRARGQTLVTIFIPSKATVYRDSISKYWQLRGVFGSSDSHVYREFVGALEKEGVNLVDARKLLLQSARRPEDIYSHHGRHWRPSAACRTFQAAIDAARPSTPMLGTQQLSCRTHPLADPSIFVGDYDLYRIMNLWGSLPSDVDVDVLDALPDPERRPVPLLAVGSSFFFIFLDLLRQQRLFEPSLFYYYDETAVDPATGRESKVVPFTDAWRHDVFTKPLVVLGLFESFLPGDQLKFLNEVDQELKDEGE